MASPNEYTPKQYRQAALKWAEKLGLMEWWPVIDWIALHESGWRGIQSTYPDSDGPGGFEDSWGPFQLYREGVGADKDPKELLEPETNAEMALRYIKEGDYGLDKGYGINAATHAWSVTHNVDMEWVNANPGQTPAPGQAGTPPALAPVTEGAGELVAPKMEDFVDPFTGKLDYERYYGAVSAYQLLEAGEPSTDPDEIEFINASIDLLAAQMSGAQVDVQKADLELGKRLSALTEAGKTYRELAPYSLPEGTEWIPGGEPGGLYERMGMGTMPAQTTHINPLATALATMGRTPEMAPTPDTSFEAAIAGAGQLQGGLGAAPSAAPPVAAPPGMALEPAAVTPSPSLAEVVAGLEPGPMSLAPSQPSAFPDFPAPAFGQMSEEDKIRIGKLLMAILSVPSGMGMPALLDLLGVEVPGPGMAQIPGMVGTAGEAVGGGVATLADVLKRVRWK